MTTKKISAKDRLVRHLTADHNADVEPDSTELAFAVSVFGASYHKGSGELVLAVWEIFEWTDSRLAWNPEDYGGVKVVRIPMKRLWTPDLKLYNSSTALVERDADINAAVHSNGRVLWVPRANYRIPAEEQADGVINGVVRLGSWTYRDVDVPLKLYAPEGFILTYFDPSSRYIISDPTATIVEQLYEGENYPMVTINFTAKRKV